MAANKEMEVDVTPENEADLIEGLLSAADYKETITKKITIEREEGKPLFSFVIHPLSIDDVDKARRNATTYMPNPSNPKLPQVVKSTSDPEFLAWEVYLATEGENGKKIWDNQALKKGLKEKGRAVMTGMDVIREILTSGEIAGVTTVVDEISGDNATLVDYAKN